MKYIIYKLEEGGDIQAVKYPTDGETEAEFRRILDRGHLDLRFGLRKVKNKPFYLALAETTEEHNL